MTKETLLYKLTGTDTPRFLTEREQNIVDACLELINDAEQLHKPNVMQAEGSAISEGAAVASEGLGEANKRAAFWCRAEMHGHAQCYVVCNLCKGYGG